MYSLINLLPAILALGIGATLTMDLWALFLKRLFDIPSLNWALVGRWLGHMPYGRFCHISIAEAPKVAFERQLGWLFHYLTGILLAAFFIFGTEQVWLKNPDPVPAVLFGFCSVVLPFILMHPCLGAGFFAAKAPEPNKARSLSLAAHSVFGLGLYFSACLYGLII